MLFAFDTIHGFRTIFPIPLGAGGELRSAGGVRRPQVRRARVGRGRAQADLCADGRRLARAPLGRIAEAAGEDPYLNSVLAAARIKAIQGTDYSAPDKLVASPKHFAAYGQRERP